MQSCVLAKAHEKRVIGEILVLLVTRRHVLQPISLPSEVRVAGKQTYFWQTNNLGKRVFSRFNSTECNDGFSVKKHEHLSTVV